MNADSLTFAVLWDSLRAVVPDTIIVSHVDTVAVPHIVHLDPSPWRETAKLVVPLAVVIFGWYWVQRLNRGAQREHFFHEIAHSTAQAVNEQLAEYERWCAWRATLMSKLYDRGVLQQQAVAEAAEHLAMPVAQTLFLLDGIQHVMDVVVSDFASRLDSLGDRHAEVSQLFARAANQEKGLVERMKAARDAQDKTFSLGNDVHGFRLHMLREVAELLKPEGYKAKSGNGRPGRKEGHDVDKKPPAAATS